MSQKKKKKEEKIKDTNALLAGGKGRENKRKTEWTLTKKLCHGETNLSITVTAFESHTFACFLRTVTDIDKTKQNKLNSWAILIKNDCGDWEALLLRCFHNQSTQCSRTVLCQMSTP